MHADQGGWKKNWKKLASEDFRKLNMSDLKRKGISVGTQHSGNEYHVASCVAESALSRLAASNTIPYLYTPKAMFYNLRLAGKTLLDQPFYLKRFFFVYPDAGTVHLDLQSRSQTGQGLPDGASEDEGTGIAAGIALLQSRAKGHGMWCNRDALRWTKYSKT